MCAAIIQILVTQNAAPILVASTLPWLQTVAILAAGILGALVAPGTLPAWPALASVRLVTEAVLLIAAGPTLGLVAVVAVPAVEANLLAARGAIIVAKLVVTGPTKPCASVAVIIERAIYSACCRRVRKKRDIGLGRVETVNIYGASLSFYLFIVKQPIDRPTFSLGLLSLSLVFI